MKRREPPPLRFDVMVLFFFVCVVLIGWITELWYR